MIELVDSSRNLDSKMPILKGCLCFFLEERGPLVFRDRFRCSARCPTSSAYTMKLDGLGPLQSRMSKLIWTVLVIDFHPPSRYSPAERHVYTRKCTQS